MRISRQVRSQVNPKKRQHITSNSSDFSQMFKTKAYQLKEQELENLIDDITSQGERLATYRSFQDLVKFKRMIQEFLQETVYNGLKLEQLQQFNQQGYSQKLMLVKEVDGKLLELTEYIMNQEEKTVDLLGTIGEIKGLLISLYT